MLSDGGVTLLSNNVAEIVGDSEQVMVYGWGFCKYLEVSKSLTSDKSSPIKKVFGCAIGTQNCDKNEITTLEGRIIEQVSIDSANKDEKNTARLCKAGLTNLIFENYKRIKEGLPIIPVIFCVDIDDAERKSNFAKYDPVDITSRKNGITNLITHEELRRCYKLCCEFEDPEIREIAKNTFKFVKLTHEGVGDDKYLLKQLKPFWEEKSWDTAFQKRLHDKEKKLHIKHHPWKKELAQMIESYISPKAMELLPKDPKELGQLAFGYTELLLEMMDELKLESLPDEKKFVDWLKTREDYSQHKKYVESDAFKKLYALAKLFSGT